VLNSVINSVSMDTKFSAAGGGSHPGVILPLFLFSLLTRTSGDILPVVISKLCKSAAHACNDEMRTRGRSHQLDVDIYFTCIRDPLVRRLALEPRCMVSSLQSGR
jgi:hypothetical protein